MTDDPNQSDDEATGGATAGERRPDPRLRLTERTQVELILDSVPEARAFPPNWREDEAGVQYLYRESSIVVRDWHRDRVLRVLPGLFRDQQPRTIDVVDVVAGATRITWTGVETGPSVQEVVRGLGRLVGEKVATPDHLLYVCAVQCCAATEPELPGVSEPYPPVPVDGAGGDPRKGRGQGVHVLVMDTGLVEGAAVDHSWLRGVTGEDDHPYVPDPSLPDRLAPDAGHGTFVAGCVRVTAPGAEVRVVNAAALLSLGADDSPPVAAVFETDLAQLVRTHLVAAAGEPPRQVPDILVINFAGATAEGDPPLSFSALYDDLLQHLGELLILAPAGNEGDERKNWPAAFDWVVSVGALDHTRLRRAPWSNHGRTVDVYAPGDRLVNAYAKGTFVYAWEGAQGQATFDGMARWSGTSFATPLVAGLVASRMSTTGQRSRRAWGALEDLADQQALLGVGPVLYPGQE